MATKNGKDPTARMVAVLESIESELHGFREETGERLGRIEAEAKQTNERLGRLETQAKRTNKRLSNVEKRLGAVEIPGLADLEERVIDLDALRDEVHARFARLEAAVFKSAAE
jgi:predicted nuclease with TOPRIM domain